MKKWMYIILGIIVAAAAYIGISAVNQQKSIGIIGGADGPTKIIVSEKQKDEKLPVIETKTAEVETSESAVAEEETTVEATEVVAENTPLTEDELDRKVAEIILAQNRSWYTGEECQAEGHIILESEVQDGTTTVYALTVYGEYQFQNVDYLIKASGTGVIPVVLSFGEHEDGREFTHMTWPDDGSGYNESVKEMFPEHLWDRVLIIQEEDREILAKMERAYAEEHLKKSGRDAVIGDYADVERTHLTDYGISVEVSNKMLEYEKYMGPYPSWVGSLEKVEDGERYLYSVFYDEETNQIVYEKRFFGTGETVEKFVYDAETGDKVEE